MIKNSPVRATVRTEEQRMASFYAWLLDLDKEMAWGSGVMFVGVNLSKKDDGWFMVVKGSSSGGERVVTYCAGPTPADCWRNLYFLNEAGQLTWKPDKYAK